jgi:hypothetical protein
MTAPHEETSQGYHKGYPKKNVGIFHFKIFIVFQTDVTCLPAGRLTIR